MGEAKPGGGSGLTRLSQVMTATGVSARQLAKASGLTNSIISRWQKGARPLTTRSGSVAVLADTLLALDQKGQLSLLLAPYRTSGESAQDALVQFLTTDDLPAMPPRAMPPQIQYSGNYITEQQVLLGARGFRKGVLFMLDYVMELPPGRQIIVCAHNGFDLFLHNVPFALLFLKRLSKAIERGTSFTLISRRGYGMENDAHFARFWLVAHLKGIMRSRYYEGEPPEEYFVGLIPGYWSGEAETDPTAEDSLVSVMSTDPRHIRRATAHCDAFLDRSTSASQYEFLKQPTGSLEDVQKWKPGPLPKWNEPDAMAPQGSFSAICRVPSIGIMTKAEFAAALGQDQPPVMPDYLFRTQSAFEPGKHQIVLCRDDVQEGLVRQRTQNEPLSALLHRRAFISRDTLAAMLERLLEAMKSNDQFEVALLPRSAFAKLELELVCWQDSASVGWLQDGRQSVFANDPITSGSFHAAIGHIWGRLHKGWKRQPLVRRTLRKWLAGQELDPPAPDSVTVQNWHVLPKEPP